MLLEAANDGTILRIPAGLGDSTTTFQANRQEFGTRGDRRSEARWEAAFERLETLGLVRDSGHKREVFQLTNTGYDLADAISGQSEGLATARDEGGEPD